MHNDHLWFKDAIIYELHIKAFRDSDGDGIGDFKGLLEKLDYLKELGVTAIWVLPFYPSPLRDDGYDIADYYNINPSYGNIEQLKEFIVEAHRRDLKVITELVINHTSDQHPWFQRARHAPKDAVERSYYVWTDDPTQYKDVRIIFQDFESSNWTWDPVAQQYYWHRFFHHQPDLNYDSPHVQAAVFRIIDFWCKLGVDGFRLDAVPYLYERENTNGENLPETHAYLKKLRQHVDTHFPGTVLLAEANMWPEDSASYFGNGAECHMNYHFPVMPRMFMALQMEDRYPITDIVDQTPEIPDNCQWAIFLRNHDELTLEMVTDEERDYMYKVYVKDPKARINLGIRHRLAPLMENNRRKIELMNVLLFSLRGTPVIYYGDEIGMGDNFYLGDRDGVRTPMQWSPDRNAGFSETNPQQLYLPVILDPEYHYESVNVETQLRNPSSLLWFMKHRIHMRRKYKAFSRGDLKFIHSENPKVLAFTRTYQEETILVVVNLSRYSQAASLQLTAFKGFVPVEIFSRNRFPAVREEDYFFTLGPHDHHWFVLQPALPEKTDPASLRTIRVTGRQENWSDYTLAELAQTILPDYLLTTKWFEGKDRNIHTIQITGHFALPVASKKVRFILFEVQYTNGLPETYQLPITFLEKQEAALYADKFPQAVICSISTADKEGILFDALYVQDVQLALLQLLAGNQSLPAANGVIEFSASAEVSNHVKNNKEIRGRVLPVDDPNTSIGFDNRFFLKIYRHVDKTINPDMEITHFLTTVLNFPQVPSLLGTIAWKGKKDNMVLGMLQEQVAYHGNGRTFMLERLNNYHDRIKARTIYPDMQKLGTLWDPVTFESLPTDLQEFIGGSVAEAAGLIGKRTGEMHLALASRPADKDFAAEPFSLHYQRSLFSGMQTLVRSAFNPAKELINRVPVAIRDETLALLNRKEEILKKLKQIYAAKMNVVKIRIHGDYDLKQVLFTGKDVAILDFHGDPTRSYSDRRLKRSPLRDVAGMIRSIHYVAFEGLLHHTGITPEERHKLEPFADIWIHYVTAFFVRGWLDKVAGSSFIPENKADLRILLETYLLEKAIYGFQYELHKRPEWVEVPVNIIRWLMVQDQHSA